MSRTYTLSEIDDMRAYLYRIECAPLNAQLRKYGYIESNVSLFDLAKMRTEEKLRTAMLGGVEPSEIRKRYEEMESR